MSRLISSLLLWFSFSPSISPAIINFYLSFCLTLCLYKVLAFFLLWYTLIIFFFIVNPSPGYFSQKILPPSLKNQMFAPLKRVCFNEAWMVSCKTICYGCVNVKNQVIQLEHILPFNLDSQNHGILYNGHEARREKAYFSCMQSGLVCWKCNNCACYIKLC